jgi:hypothetical protein
MRSSSDGLFHNFPFPIGTAVNGDSFGCPLIEGREKGMALGSRLWLHKASSMGLTLSFTHGMIGLFNFELAWDPNIWFLLLSGSVRFGRVHFGLSRGEFEF